MQLPKNPILRAITILGAVGLGIIGLGYLGMLGVLIAVSLPGGTETVSLGPEWTTTEIYLRNRTAAPLRVKLTMARPALRPDSVWWPVEVSPEAVGQALALHDSLVAQGIYYSLRAPLLLPGTADTLIDANFDDSLPRSLIQRRRYNNTSSVRAHTQRHFSSPPVPDPAMSLRPVPSAPDSLCLVLVLAPGDSLRVARRKTAFFFSERGKLLTTEGERVPYAPPYSPLDTSPPYQEPYGAPYLAPYRPPTVRVQWIDAQGRVRQQRPPLWALLRLPEAVATLPNAGYYLVRRYWDYR